jgi:hypothetical protein
VGAGVMDVFQWGKTVQIRGFRLKQPRPELSPMHRATRDVRDEQSGKIYEAF